MATIQTRSVTPGGILLPVWAIAIVVVGMILIVLGVVHGALFLPGVWVLVIGFLALITSSLYLVATGRA